MHASCGYAHSLCCTCLLPGAAEPGRLLTVQQSTRPSTRHTGKGVQYIVVQWYEKIALPPSPSLLLVLRHACAMCSARHEPQLSCWHTSPGTIMAAELDITARSSVTSQNVTCMQVSGDIISWLIPQLLEACAPGSSTDWAVTDGQAVAGAALCAACLLNMPASFVELLLCVPWHKLSSLRGKPDIQALASHAAVSRRHRAACLAAGLPEHAVAVLCSFLNERSHEARLPPFLQLTHDGDGTKLGHAASDGPVTLEVRSFLFQSLPAWRGECACFAQGEGLAALHMGLHVCLRCLTQILRCDARL